MILEITFEQLCQCLILPAGTKLTLLRQEPEEVLEGKLSLLCEMPGLFFHYSGAKLRRIPFEQLVLAERETKNGSTN